LAAADVSLDASDITTIESLAAQAVGARGDESYRSIAIFSAGLRGDGAAGLKAKAHQVDRSRSAQPRLKAKAAHSEMPRQSYLGLPKVDSFLVLKHLNGYLHPQ
jgi:hypothetical protein